MVLVEDAEGGRKATGRWESREHRTTSTRQERSNNHYSTVHSAARREENVDGIRIREFRCSSTEIWFGRSSLIRFRTPPSADIPARIEPQHQQHKSHSTHTIEVQRALHPLCELGSPRVDGQERSTSSSMAVQAIGKL